MADATGRQSRILSLVSVLRSLDVLKSDDLWMSALGIRLNENF